MMTKLKLGNLMPAPGMKPRCPLCRERFALKAGLWPMQPIAGTDAAKPVCLDCATDAEPVANFAQFADCWPELMEQIRAGCYAEPDDVAIPKALAALAAERRRRAAPQLRNEP